MAATPDLARGPALLAVSITTEILALSTCLVRYRVWRRSAGRMGLDEYTIAAAAAVSLVGTVLSIVEGSSMVDSAHALEFDWLGQPWLVMGTTLSKIAICLLFFRLVGSGGRWRVLLIGQILLMAVLNIGFSLTTNLQCRPLHKLWDPAVVGVCWDPSIQLNIGYVQGALSVLWWLFVSFFSVMIARDLDMHGRRIPWPFYLLSGLSVIAAVFASIRTYATSRTVSGVYTSNTFLAAALFVLEQSIGIVAANVLPVASKLWNRQRQATRLESRLISAASSNEGQRQGHGHAHGHNDPFESGAASAHSVARRSGTNDGDSSSSKTASKPGNTLRRAIVGMSEALMKWPGREGSDSRRLRTLTPKAAAPQEGQWPLGIVKTVEVEVVQEDIANVHPQHQRLPSGASGAVSVNGSSVSSSSQTADGRGSRHGGMGSDKDWTALPSF